MTIKATTIAPRAFDVLSWETTLDRTSTVELRLEIALSNIKPIRSEMDLLELISYEYLGRIGITQADIQSKFPERFL